jgi:hypothetical protein
MSNQPININIKKKIKEEMFLLRNILQIIIHCNCNSNFLIFVFFLTFNLLKNKFIQQ